MYVAGRSVCIRVLVWYMHTFNNHILHTSCNIHIRISHPNMNAISHTPLSLAFICQAHEIPIHATGHTITYQGFKLLSSLNHLVNAT